MLTPLEAFFFHDFNNSYIAEILKEIYIDKIYEPFLLGKTDQVIVDIGANIGLTSYYFKDHAIRVYAVEPSREHLQAIDTMIKFNNIENIKVIPFAVGDRNTASYIFHSTNKTMYGLNPATGDKGTSEAVMVLDMESLFNFMGIDRINFLKLDPEGAEGIIVKSQAFKNVAPKIKTIVGELHAWSGITKEDFKKELESLGYKFNWISEEGVLLYSAERI